MDFAKVIVVNDYEQGILNTADVHWHDGTMTTAYDLVFSYECV